MNKKEIVKEVLGLYVDRFMEQEKFDVRSNNESMDRERFMKYVEEPIVEMLPEVVSLINNPDEFIKIVQELIVSEGKIFQITFAEPFLDEFINALLFDMKKKKILNDECLASLKKEYSDRKINIYI